MMFHWLSSFFMLLVEECMRILVSVALAVVVNYALIYAYMAAWQLYTHTHIGQRFIEISPHISEQIGLLLAQEDRLMFSVNLVTISIVAAVVVALLAQFFFIRHLLYTNANLFIKMLICLLFSFGLAYYYMDHYQLSSIKIAMLLFAPSALILLPACLMTASKIVPDLGQIMLGSFNMIRHLFTRS